jgi:glycosyltransferase involved in cell wall biosynthesis
VVPDPGSLFEPTPPEGRTLQLCIAASDPARKRVDFAVDVVGELVKMGYAARLVFIGARYEPAISSPLVEWAGQLRLSDPVDRTRHASILDKSHLMLLPSTGEAFSIATMEAAHFGRPSVVTNTGGMATQVSHDETGLVMPIETTPANWAESIDRLMRDRDRYLAMCRAARERARAEFTWLAWGNRVVQIIEDVVRPARPGPRAL